MKAETYALALRSLSQNLSDSGNCRPLQPNLTPWKDIGTNYKAIYLIYLENKLFFFLLTIGARLVRLLHS